MPSDVHEYRLQLLLAPEAREARVKNRLKKDLQRLGIEVSGEGAATLSGRMLRRDFTRLFGSPRPETDPAFDELAVPDDLKERVTSITLAPRHLHLE